MLDNIISMTPNIHDMRNMSGKEITSTSAVAAWFEAAENVLYVKAS